MKVQCSRSGVDFIVSKIIAQDENGKLMISKVAPKLWRFIHMDAESKTVSEVGEQFETKGHAMLCAESYAKSWGYTESEILK